MAITAHHCWPNGSKHQPGVSVLVSGSDTILTLIDAIANVSASAMEDHQYASLVNLQIALIDAWDASQAQEA